MGFLCFWFFFYEVYPKVKVRAESQQDHNNYDHKKPHVVHNHKWCSLLTLKDVQFLLSLKDVQFLSFQDSCSPEKEQHDVIPRPVVKTPESDVPSVVTPTVSASEGIEKKSNPDVHEKERPNIRAGLIPRPRAVVSSPNNDAVIGNKNRSKVVRHSPLKNHNSIPNRHAHCKAILKPSPDESSIKARRSLDLPANASDRKREKGSVTASPKHVRTIEADTRRSMRI